MRLYHTVLHLDIKSWLLIYSLDISKKEKRGEKEEIKKKNEGEIFEAEFKYV